MAINIPHFKVAILPQNIIKYNNSQNTFLHLPKICSKGLLKDFTCIIIIILFCLLVSRLLTACKILLQLGLAAVPDVSLRGEREMSKHLSDLHGAHAGATRNQTLLVSSPLQGPGLDRTMDTSADKDTADYFSTLLTMRSLGFV